MFFGGVCLVSRREYGCCRKGCSNTDRKPWLFLEGTRSEIQEHNRGDRSVFSLNRLELAAPFIRSLLNARLSTDQVIVQNKWVYSGVAPSHLNQMKYFQQRRCLKLFCCVLHVSEAKKRNTHTHTFKLVLGFNLKYHSLDFLFT